MPDLAHRAVRQQYLHDVEAEFYFGIFKQSQIIQRCLREQPPLSRVHRRRRPRPAFRRPRFYLDEDEAVGTASHKDFIHSFSARLFENQINFSPLGSEIGGKELHPLLL